MSIWSRIQEALSALRQGEPLSVVFERFRGPPERSVAFTIAVIALGAKMAKADGRVTRQEVAAFREVFHIAPEDEPAAARVFDLARQDVAGYDHYARQIARMFGEGQAAALYDIFEGLFYIAANDGELHPDEEAFLRDVHAIFELPETAFRTVQARFVKGTAPDPYEVLGLAPGAGVAAARAAWKREVRESHPDRLIARGLPQEAVRMAERRMQAVNEAWEEISGRRAQPA